MKYPSNNKMFVHWITEWLVWNNEFKNQQDNEFFLKPGKVSCTMSTRASTAALLVGEGINEINVYKDNKRNSFLDVFNTCKCKVIITFITFFLNKLNNVFSSIEYVLQR